MKNLFLLLLSIPLLVGCQQIDTSKGELLFTAEVNGRWDLYSIDFTASNPEKNIKRLSESFGKNFDGHWSPDGKQIAFVSTRDGNEEIYVADANGHNPHNLTHDASDDGSFTWSPDGTQIVFESKRSGSWEIYVMDAKDGSNVHNLSKVDTVIDRSPIWSPDGKQIAYTSYRNNPNIDGIYMMSANGDNPYRLTGSGYELAWSPDGKSIAFKSILFENNAEVDEIFSVDIATSTLHRLTNDSYVDSDPAWTADSKQIAFTSGSGHIFIMNADGSNRSGLFGGTDSNEFHPDWKPETLRLTSNG